MEQRGKSNILIVDDEERASQIIQDLFELEGFRVFTAENGQTALKCIESTPIDLVITDFEMPIMNGFELLQAVNRGYPDLPVIMLTGQYREDMDKAIASLKEGAYDYLLKPVDLSTLRKSAFTALHLSQTRKESRQLNQALQDAHDALNKKSEKLEELTRIHNDLLEIISQDLEAPLTILTGSCKMLIKEEGTGLSEKQREAIEQISRNGENIQNIIGDLLDLALVEIGPVRIRKVETGLHAILDKCRRNLYPVASQRGVSIDLQPPSGLRPVYADEGKIKQVFFNLLYQAILWSDRNRAIRIGILPLPHDQKVEILLRSVTVSMDSAAKALSGEEEAIIEKKTRYRLSLCREIVELHQGKIWVEKGIEGEVIFCVQVPNLFLKPGSGK